MRSLWLTTIKPLQQDYSLIWPTHGKWSSSIVDQTIESIKKNRYHNHYKTQSLIVPLYTTRETKHCATPWLEFSAGSKTLKISIENLSLSLSAFALLQYQVQVTVAFSNPRVSFPFPRFRVLLHFHFHFRIETFLTYISRSCIFNSMFFPNLFGSWENERKEGKCWQSLCFYLGWFAKR